MANQYQYLFSQDYTLQGSMGNLTTLVDSNSSTEAKIKSGTDLTLSFLLSLGGSNETAQANAETAKNQAKGQTIDDAIKNSTQKTQQAVDAVTDKIEANISDLKQLLDNIESQQEEKEAYQKQLEVCQKTIEDNKAILNDPNSTQEEKKSALEAITGVRSTIEDLSPKINVLSASIEESNAEVTKIDEQNENLDAHSVEISEQGIQEQQGLQTQKNELQAQNMVTQSRGVSDEAIGSAANAAAESLQAAGTASSAIPIVGTLFGSASQATAMKLVQIGLDYSGAGSVITPAVGSLISNLTNMNGAISTNLTDFANIPTAIGSMVDDGNNVSYNYFDISNSLGSFLTQASGIEEEGANLEAAVEDAESKIEDVPEEEENSEETEPSNSQVFDYEPDIIEDLIA